MTLLTVWLHGHEYAQVERLRSGRLRLRHAAEAINRYGLAACPLSLSMPVTDRRIESPALERYLDNLLPESPLRATLEREHRLRPGDVFGLLSVIGSECAGAVQFTAGDAPDPGLLRPLSTEEAGRIVRDLPTLVPPDDLPISASLGGIQAKVLLTWTGDGWAWPAGGAMSTHLVKPEPVSAVGIDNLVWLEEWTLRLAANAGLRASRAHLEDFGGRTAIVVERFDRTGGRRTHQEDCAQALGLAPSEKYESSLRTPGRLQRIATAAGPHAVDGQALLLDLLRTLVFHTVIGDGDAHSKNYSLQIDEDGRYRMAPLYDVAPVFLVDPRFIHAGHAVNGQVNLRYITSTHLVEEATAWGIPRDRARDTVVELALAIEAAAAETPVDDRIASVVEPLVARARQFAAGA